MNSITAEAFGVSNMLGTSKLGLTGVVISSFVLFFLGLAKGLGCGVLSGLVGALALRHFLSVFFIP